MSARQVAAILAASFLLIPCVAMTTLFMLVKVWTATLPDLAVDTPIAASISHPRRAVVFFDKTVPLTMRRAEAALQLAFERQIDRVLLVGGARPARSFYGSEVMLKQLSIRPGFAEAIWAADRSSYDTLSNLDAIVKWTRASGPGGTIILISDDLHLFRIRWLINSFPLEARIAYLPTDSRGRSLRVLIWRLVWELGAWVSMLVPDDCRIAMLDRTR